MADILPNLLRPLQLLYPLEIPTNLPSSSSSTKSSIALMKAHESRMRSRHRSTHTRHVDVMHDNEQLPAPDVLPHINAAALLHVIVQRGSGEAFWRRVSETASLLT